MGRFLLVACLVLGIAGVILWQMGALSPGENEPPGDTDADTNGTRLKGDFKSRPEFTHHGARARSDTRVSLFDPVTVRDSTVTLIQELQVPSRVIGVIERIDVFEGDIVKANETVLAKLDDNELELAEKIKHRESKSTAAEEQAIARLRVAEGTLRRDEESRKRAAGSVTAREIDIDKAQITLAEKEQIKAVEDREKATDELGQIRMRRGFHTIKSDISGVLDKVYKKKGDAVKEGEALFRVINLDKVWIDGLVELQHAELVRPGMRAVVEPEVPAPQMRVLRGHTLPVRSLAVAADSKMLASASDDHDVILWSWPEGRREATFHHPQEVYAVAAGPVQKDQTYVFLTGCRDGHARVLRYTPTKGAHEVIPLKAEEGAHRDAVRSVAFSRDGKRAATGGDDKLICIWEVESDSARLLYRLHADPDDKASFAHRSGVVSVHFTPDGHLISAGRDDGTLKVWKLNETDGELLMQYSGRTRDVHQLGISSDGERLLFDHGEELRILDRKDGNTLGAVWSSGRGAFDQLAIFSPSGRMVLAASGKRRLQLWTVPRSALPAAAGASIPAQWPQHGYEIRNLTAPDALNRDVNCAAFAPDESVVFTAGEDELVRAWVLPATSELGQPLDGKVIFVGSQVETAGDRPAVRIRAELENPRDSIRMLKPGTRVNLTVYPEPPKTAKLKD